MSTRKYVSMCVVEGSVREICGEEEGQGRKEGRGRDKGE